ncbi:plancitoxin-1 [Prorops nasuta]|uniref:plancitoxin-1 n=1 Tax=Prorops nasuta TaxID=863751 RepID=UPI0034CD62D6
MSCAIKSSILLTTKMLLYFVSFLLFFSGIECNLQCMDENNEPVDWYVMYKLPKISQSSNPLIRQGSAYIYITNKSLENGWTLSKKNINSKSSIPGNTLAPLYDDVNLGSKMWALYNDKAPNKPVTLRNGHAKGVMMVKEDGGFWLIHSVPNFPPTPNGGTVNRPSENNSSNNKTTTINDGEYSYPTTGQNYGQSFLCISLSNEYIDTIGLQLMYNQITVYSKNLPEKLKERFPIFLNATNQKKIRKAPFNHKAILQSLGSVEFTSFAKSDKWQKDLYEEFVASQLQTDLLAETWQHGTGKLPTNCHGLKVYNVESIHLVNANVDFKSTNDHSKWAIAADNKSNRSWVCIGDINRADTQYNRGGGTVCINSKALWKNYRDAVNDIEPCPRRGLFQNVLSWFG